MERRRPPMKSTTSGADILTVALNPTIDVTWEVDGLDPSGKNRARPCSVVAGGGGINVTRAVVRLGGSARALHTAGRDLGRRLDRLLDEEGLDHVSVPIEEETREALVLLDAAEQRSFHIVPPGPSLSEEEGRRCLEALVEAAVGSAYAVLSGSLPEGLPDDFYARAVRSLGDTGARVVLDTSGDALRAGLEEGVFLVKPNRREASALVGTPVETLGDARNANAALLDRGAAEVVVTTVGELGAVCSTRDGHREVRTPPLPGEPVSDAGAGDSFIAAATLGLAGDEDPVDAVAWGVAAAAASVLRPPTELFDLDDVHALRPQVEIR